MTEQEYNAASEIVSDLMDKDPEQDSPEGVELVRLVLLMEAYERQRFPELFG